MVLSDVSIRGPCEPYVPNTKALLSPVSSYNVVGKLGVPYLRGPQRRLSVVLLLVRCIRKRFVTSPRSATVPQSHQQDAVDYMERFYSK